MIEGFGAHICHWASKSYQQKGLHTKTLTGTGAQLVEHPLCDWDVAGLIPRRVIPKTLKVVLAALSLGTQH